MALGLKRGDILKGRYEIQRQIGKGGMSRVFMAADLQLNNKLWAVKEVDRHAKDPSGRPIEQALAKEAQILSKLEHPKIASIHDTETTDDFIYVVMDYVEGESLDRIVRREGPQSEANVQKWMLEICDVLGYLHSQNPPIIYRDMKPNNIMLHPDGYVKLIDFGVVREYKDQADIRQDTIAFGTQGYAPPEQYGKAQTDATADIYAMGATMWHLLAGEAPPMEFPLRDVREKAPSVGEGFAEEIIPKCTKLERRERYQTCEELAANLEIYEELTREYRSRQVRKVRGFAISAILAVVFLVAGFGLMRGSEVVRTANYENIVAVAENMVQSNPSGAEDQFKSAIAMKSDGYAAYEGLINCYKVDGVFDSSEKAQFDDVYQTNLETLKNDSEQFAALSYDIGQLYWTYYADDSSEGTSALSDEGQATRIRYSADYFANAEAAYASAGSNMTDSANYRRASIYSGIASFITGIASAEREAQDTAEMYQEYWENLEQLSGIISSEDNELVQLNSCLLVANALETYVEEFKNVVTVDGGDELSVDDVEQVYKAVKSVVDSQVRESGNGVAKKYSDQWQELKSRMENKVQPRITLVFSGATVNAD